MLCMNKLQLLIILNYCFTVFYDFEKNNLVCKINAFDNNVIIFENKNTLTKLNQQKL
jgi:hypothetical protein